MKTTLDIPDKIFRQAKARAALRGISLRQFVTEALEKRISSTALTNSSSAEPPWMKGFGALSDLGDETRQIDSLIAEAFGKLDQEDGT